ncbi:unnamed protein product [Penicillium salamii]|nr:unnamed protein product [Penicillium salamii]
MVGSFISAFLVAALHAVFYQVLTGTPTDGPESRVPQTYETTISVILSSTFTLLIHFCLGLSFTQYLWYILRRQPLAILTIEHIFTLRSNPLSLFDKTVFRRARPLVMVAIIYWFASIAMSFPPGAITVVSSLQEVHVLNADVPTFNASDKNPPLSLAFDYNLKPALHGMIQRTILARRVEDAPSTCSANCSYSLHFTGPYLRCTVITNTSTLQVPSENNMIPIFYSSTEQSSIQYDFYDDPKIKDPPSHSYITISTFSPQNIRRSPPVEGDDEADSEWRIDMINHHWTCIPSRADYTVLTTYKDNVRSLEVNIDESSIEPLMPAPPSFIDVERKNPNFSLPLNSAVAPILRDANIYSIITPVMKTISGSFNATWVFPESDIIDDHTFTTTFPPYILSRNPDDYFRNSTEDYMTILPIAQYFSGVQISPSFSNITVNNSGPFTINEASINAMLQDVVLSIISYQPYNWTTKVNQTRNEIRNIYTFSRPLNLFLPYGLMLLGTLCAMAFGFYALSSNGVPATDGGFLQLFTTAQRSGIVDRIARGGCLGGEENVSTALKDLKIQFGELVETNDSEIAVLSTAGFGTEHEVRPLKRERIYGGL